MWKYRVTVLIASLLVLFPVAAADGDNSDYSYSTYLGDGEYKKKDASHYWSGCTTSTISCGSDEFKVGEEKRGSTGEYSDNNYCNVEWYDKFNPEKCSNYGDEESFIGLSKERSWQDGTQGGGISQTQCGASSGGGDEVVSGSAVYCKNPVGLPSNPSPTDSGKASSGDVNLGAQFNDPTGESGTLEFFNASDDSSIGSCSTGDQSSCSVTWSDVGDGTHEWYVVGDDGTTSRSSPVYSFSTNRPPDSPSNPDPANNTVTGENPELSVDVSDPDGDLLDVWFFNRTVSESVPWWNSDWKYRKSIQIQEESGKELSNYQVLINDPYFNESGLVGSWHFDRVAGATAEDTSGNRNHGALNGASWASGKYDESVKFSGSETVNLGDLDVQNGSTVSFWFSPSTDFDSASSSGEGLWGKFEKINHQSLIALNGQDMRQNGAPDGSLWAKVERDEGAAYLSTSKNSWSSDKWYHVSFVIDYSEDKAKLYVDGNLRNETELGQNDLKFNADSIFGAAKIEGVNLDVSENEYRYFDGKIDEARMYNRALSTSEIRKMNDSKIKPNYNDIRFVNSTNDELDYWMEHDGKFWVEVSSLESSTTKEIFAYYGNPIADLVSNGTATFMAFDDFEDRDVKEWADPDNLLSVDDSRAKSGLNSLHWDYSGSNPKNAYLPNQGQTGDFVFDYWFYPVTKPTDDWTINTGLGSGSGGINWRREVGGNIHFEFNEHDTGTELSTDQWYRVRQTAKQSSNEMIYEINSSGARYVPKTSLSLDGSGNRITLRQAAYNSQSSEGYYDLFRARKYAEPAPTVSFGSEKNGPEREVILDDSYPNYPGWSNTPTTRCGSRGMIGGYGEFNGDDSTSKTIPDLPEGDYIVAFDYYHIDSWDGYSDLGADNSETEKGRFFWNGDLKWERVSGMEVNDLNVCGDSTYGDSKSISYPTTFLKIQHSGGDAKLEFDSTLHQEDTDESWGVDNIRVVRSKQKGSTEESLIDVDENVDSSTENTASITWNHPQCGNQYNWYAVVGDGQYNATINSFWNFSVFCNQDPYVADIEPGNGETGVDRNPNVSAAYRDEDGDTGSIEFYSEDGAFIGGCTDMAVGERCEKNYSSADGYSENYQWETVVSDGKVSVSSIWSFETRSYGANDPQVGRIDVDFQGGYSVFSIRNGTSENVPLVVSNPEDERNVTLRIVEGSSFASFTNGKSSRNFTIENGDRDFFINVEPDFAGERTLKVEAINRKLNIGRTAEVSIISDTTTGVPVNSPNQVPGITWINLLVIAAASSAYFLLP